MATKIGLIADIQYADVPDTWDFAQTVKRRYRHTLHALGRAITLFKANDVSEIVNLGDLIDGRNRDIEEGTSSALNEVMKEFSKAENMRIFHLIGNHDLYNFTRDQLIQGVGSFRCADSDGRTYRSFSINTRWTGLVLDGYEESLLSVGGGRVGNELTVENGGINKKYFDICQKHNPNDLSRYKVDFFQGLEGVESRWVAFNGGVSGEQLKWLDNELKSAADKAKNVCIFSHLIAHPDASPGYRTLFWNYEQVLQVLRKHESARIFIAGHAHKERYVRDGHTHHLTLPSALEVEGDDCCAVLSLAEDGSAVLNGFGMTSRQW